MESFFSKVVHGLVRNPEQRGHGFRWEVGHPFRCKLAIDSGMKLATFGVGTGTGGQHETGMAVQDAAGIINTEG
jgi:hypothetical protein